MIRFSDFITEQQNTHLEHVEDELLNGGVAGARKAINMLRGVRDMLAGHTKSPVNATIKFDGAPAVFAGIDPSDGKFFVAKKGIFNKSPKVYKTAAEVDADTSGDLAAKLKLALKHLPELGITGVVQGDFMFAKEDLKVQEIDGQEYVTFHPNTIMYAVPTASPMARTIRAAKFGVVWHTRYEGSSFETMKAAFAADIASTLKASKNVWSIDATYKDLSGQATFTAAETKEVTSLLSDAGKLFQSIKPALFNDISSNEDLLMLVKTSLNALVREGQTLSPVARAEHVQKFVKAKVDADIASKKTTKGQESAKAKYAATLAYFDKHSIADIARLMDLMDKIVAVKAAIIAKMNQASAFKTFLKLHAGGFRATTPEGYVAVDRLSQSAIKLVDRMEFSRANFASDVVKGWQR